MTREERIEAALATAGKASKGPWWACCSDEDGAHSHFVFVEESDGGCVCHMSQNDPNDPGYKYEHLEEIVTHAERQNNARLLQAAPDLRDEVIALRAQVGDMAAIVRKLVHRLGPENTTSKQALDYLFRKGLQGSPARDTALSQIESEEVEGCEDCDDGCGCTDGPCFGDDHKEAQT